MCVVETDFKLRDWWTSICARNAIRKLSSLCLVEKVPRRVAAKVEWHPGELYPRVGFIVTNLPRPAERVLGFYNQRGTCEQWIKEGKSAVKWTRLPDIGFGSDDEQTLSSHLNLTPDSPAYRPPTATPARSAALRPKGLRSARGSLCGRPRAYTYTGSTLHADRGSVLHAD